MKKHLLLLLGILLSLPAAARDFDYTYEGQTITYSIIKENETVFVKGVPEDNSTDYISGDLILPSVVYDGNTKYSVTVIGGRAFYNCVNLTSVVIPNSITTICDDAFHNCYNLKSINIPNSVNSIGDSAFKGCGLITVVIPNTLDIIDSNTFANCISLTSVYISDSVTKIGGNAFGNCHNLTWVNIPNSVKAIGRGAFENSGLNTLTIGNSVNEIGYGAFSGCSSLTSLEIKGDRVLDINYCFGYTLYSGNIIVPSSVFDEYKAKYPNYHFLSDTYPFNVSFVNLSNQSFKIGYNDNVVINLSLDNSYSAIGFQADITLPAGLTIAEKDEKLDVYFGENTATGSHVISASKVDGENKYRIVAYSSKNETFKSGENLLNINIVSGNNHKGGNIIIDNTVISLADGTSRNPDAMTISVMVAEPLYGDSNDNGIVAIDDVVTDVQYILEKNPTPFSFKKADVNRDNTINIIDVSKTVAIILSNAPANAPRRTPAIGLSNSLPGLSAEIVSHSASRKTMAVSLGDVENITALQGDIELPEGVRVTGISISTEQKSNHKVDFAYIGDNRVRFVVYSLSLARMNGDAPMVEVALDCDSSATDRNVELYDLMASDTDSNLMNFNALSVGISNGTTTGIESVTADDEPVRYFLINGTEVKDVSTPGFYIVRKGGKVSKVMRNSLQSKAPVGR